MYQSQPPEFNLQLGLPSKGILVQSIRYVIRKTTVSRRFILSREKFHRRRNCTWMVQLFVLPNPLDRSVAEISNIVMLHLRPRLRSLFMYRSRSPTSILFSKPKSPFRGGPFPPAMLDGGCSHSQNRHLFFATRQQRASILYALC